MISFNILIFLISGYLILKAATLFIKGAVDISLALKLSKVFIAITIVSLVTTMPELIVSATSSYIGQTGLAVGNVIGSCICNIGLVFAIGAIIRDVIIKKEDFYRMTSLFIALFFVYFFISNGILSRIEGAMLLLLLILFLAFNYYLAKRFKENIDDNIRVEHDKNILRKGIIYFLSGGILTLIIARYGLIHTGLNIANYFKVPPVVIGLSLVALGTSLPELFTIIVSSRKKHSEIVFGNIVGANVLNLFWVLGVSAIIRPLEIDRQTLTINMPIAVFITIVMFLLGFGRLKFNRKKGIVLLIVYVAYIISLFAFMYK